MLSYENFIENNKSIMSKIYLKNNSKLVINKKHNYVYCDMFDECLEFYSYEVYSDSISTLYIFNLTREVFYIHFRWPENNTKKILIIECLDSK